MSRPRNRVNSNLPDNLYCKHDKRTNKVYFTYRDPRNGKFHGLGTDKQAAENDAKALNAAIYTTIRSARLAVINNPVADTPTFSRVTLKHLELSETKRKLAKNTLRAKKTLVNAWEKALGKDTLIGDIDVRKIRTILDSYEDRPRMCQAMRSEAIDIWKSAIEEGWVNENIPEKTRASTVEVKRSRLSLEDFNRIHAAALKLKDKWLARAMELALVTAQRREDVSMLEFKQTKDSIGWVENDSLCVIQQKTKNKVRLPLHLGINGLTIGSVVKSCRDNTVSKWLLHHSCHRAKTKPGDQVFLDSITHKFAEVRDAVGVEVEEGKTPPSFHEIRSLAVRLYSELHGDAVVQAIAGHKNGSMTAVYRDVRGSEWIQVKV